jgi:pimeloyl-ACP methyl ester carboxylesterase
MRQPDLFVDSENVRLAVYTWGSVPSADAPKEVLMLAHGFPDRAMFWEKVAHELSDRFYVVAYDMRGCGASTHITGYKYYQYERLLNDLYAVIDAVSPQQKVHLVGHDWGGLYGWSAIVASEGIKRIASFATLSPSLDQIGFFLRQRMLKPTPNNLIQLLSQLLRNSLMTFFTLPILPEILWRSGVAIAMFRVIIGHYEKRITFQPNDGVEGDAVRYLGIYRANLLQRVLRPKKEVSSVPVHAMIAQHDPFLPPWIFEDSVNWTKDYSETAIDASHWAPLSQPVALANAISSFVGRNRVHGMG